MGSAELAEVIDGPRAGKLADDLDPDQLTSLARAYSRLFAETEDRREALAQEACARAWAGRHSFAPSLGSLEQWVFGIVRNTAREAWRHDRRERSLWERIRGATPATPSELDAAALRQDISSAMSRLSQRDQQLIYWRYWGRRRYRDIAAELGLDERAARQAARRAVARLGRYLT